MIRMSSASLSEAVRTLHPGYFALVMATGIVSVGLRSHDMTTLSATLMWLAGGCYLVLLVVSAWRIAVFPTEVRRDLADPTRAFGFFTFVAGTNVLGARLALEDYIGAAAVLLVVGGLAWLLLGYLVPWTAVLGRRHRPETVAANGTWFIWVVAGQSVAVLAAVLEPVVSTGQRELALVAVCSWSVGVVLYGVVGISVVARLLLDELGPEDLTPPYWVAMGATAITALAGARIVQMTEAPTVTAIRDMVAGTSVVFWSFGTWLIPALLAAGWWRHVTHRVPLRYEATWWSIVFPLGMYGVAGVYLGAAIDLPLMAAIGRNEIWLAFAVWTATLTTLLVHLSRMLTRDPPSLARTGSADGGATSMRGPLND